MNSLWQILRITAKAQNKIFLSWPRVGDNVSHYIIERGVGHETFSQAGVFFMHEHWNEAVHWFIDDVNSDHKGPLVYRLRAVGHDGAEVVTSNAFLQTT